MDANPYSPPQSVSIDTDPIPRKRWVIVVLALIAPPIAMLYVARPVRAVMYLCAAILNLLLAVLIGSKSIASPQILQFCGSLLISIVAAFDGIQLSRNWNRTTLPWYSRVPALIGILGAGWLSLLSVRAFVAEPFRIPASSMEPTLKIGDYIVVNKSAYGWNIPLTNQRLINFGHPLRGDIIVFRYPQDENIYYIKRVIGLPGDTIVYADKRVSLNGTMLHIKEERAETLLDPRSNVSNTFVRYQETLGDVSHPIWIDPKSSTYHASSVQGFPKHENCQYREESFTCKVPTDHYFVMGDNRDRSSDSRYWGFVPEGNIIGRASRIWYSEQDASRAGTLIK